MGVVDAFWLTLFAFNCICMPQSTWPCAPVVRPSPATSAIAAIRVHPQLRALDIDPFLTSKCALSAALQMDACNGSTLALPTQTGRQCAQLGVRVGVCVCE
jgi:hypothetical protein